MNAHILLVDDDTVLSNLLKTYLEGEGFTITHAPDGQSAITQCEKTQFNALVLDIMMPKLNGLDTLKQIRANQNNTPVIMLSARGEAFDRILGLELGADDYLPKPCDPRELSARLKAIIKRSNTPQTIQNISYRNLNLNLSSRQSRVDGILIEMTQTEFDLLTLLIKNAGQLQTKEYLSINILGKPLESFDRSLDMHISNLRKKLKTKHVDIEIKTIRGQGYLIEPTQ